MSTSKSQKQKILKLSVKDKKLARLFFSSDLTQKDSLFLNSVYQQRNNLQFRYCIGLSVLTAMVVNWVGFRFASGLIKGMVLGGVFGSSHLFWTGQINRRFTELTEPYYEKYGVK